MAGLNSGITMFSLAFLRANWRELLFGFALCFLSSFGQTFFISLFGGEIRSELGITDGEFGSYYSIATIASAGLLMYSGRLVDRLRLRDMAALVLAGLAVVSFAMSWLSGPVMLVAVFFGLRQFGQGLASHTGVTSVARRFSAERGRALSITNMGHSTAEAVLPIAVVALIAIMDWRNLWLINAAILFASIPLIRRLIGTGRGDPLNDHAAPHGRRVTGIDHTTREVLAEPSLWFRLPAVMAPSFVYTGLIFHQVSLVEIKGWSMSFWASNYILFAVVAIGTVIVAGPLIDRFGARRIMLYYLTPLMLSCVALGLSSAEWVIPVFMVLMAVNTGVAQVIYGAVWAELYGTRNLGGIRALAQAVMVFSSGLAPGAMGLAMDRGVSIETISLSCAAYCMIASLIAGFAPSPRKEAAI